MFDLMTFNFNKEVWINDITFLQPVVDMLALVWINDITFLQPATYLKAGYLLIHNFAHIAMWWLSWFEDIDMN